MSYVFKTRAIKKVLTFWYVTNCVTVLIYSLKLLFIYQQHIKTILETNDQAKSIQYFRQKLDYKFF